ncbi:MAG: tetratricopeptide repeat protein [Sandaracinaceae bacterium]
MGRLLVLALATVFGGMSIPAPAPALAQDEVTTAQARQLFQEGMAAIDAGDSATAVDRLRRSLALRDSAVVRYNLALVLIETRSFLAATEHLRAVQRMAPEGSEIAASAAERLAAAEAHLGRLRVEIDGDREAVTARVDGRPLAPALIGVEHPQDPGVHRVEIFRGDRQLASTEVSVSRGASTEARLFARPPTPEEQGVLPPRTEEDGGGIESEWWFWVLLGAVVAGGAVALGVILTMPTEGEPTLRGDDGMVHTTLIEARW